MPKIVLIKVEQVRKEVISSFIIGESKPIIKMKRTHVSSTYLTYNVCKC